MPARRSYKQTLFDRHGPDAGLYVRTFSYGLIAAGVSIPLFASLGVLLELRTLPYLALVLLGPVAVGYVVTRAGIRFIGRVGEGVHTVLAGGSSTPYTEQHSYQQALVMQGRLDEALESLEAIIAEAGSTVDVRIRAAELYAREAKRPDRAAELLREAIRHPQCTPGEEVYAANRLADILSGPLNQPGRALVELRRLADRYTGTPVGDRARDAIRALKAVQAGEEGDLYTRAE
jgi:hypothetical protein